MDGQGLIRAAAPSAWPRDDIRKVALPSFTTPEALEHTKASGKSNGLATRETDGTRRQRSTLDDMPVAFQIFFDEFLDEVKDLKLSVTETRKMALQRWETKTRSELRWYGTKAKELQDHVDYQAGGEADPVESEDSESLVTSSISADSSFSSTSDHGLTSFEENTPVINDADLLPLQEEGYVIDPTTHYERLHALQSYVEWNSALRWCQGSYNLLNPMRNRNDPRLLLCPGETKAALEHARDVLNERQRGTWINNELMRGIIPTDPKSWFFHAHMIEAYLTILQVQKSVAVLERLKFGQGSYSIIIRSSNTQQRPVAEVKAVTSALLEEILFTMELMVTHYPVGRYDANIPLPDKERSDLSKFLYGIVTQLGFSDVVRLALSWGDIMAQFRFIASVLDLGLVSYVGSHGVGSAFQSTFVPDGLGAEITQGNLPLELQPLRLTCLDGFLQQQLWVFAAQYSQDFEYEASALPLLTRISDLIDLWGPVWTMRPYEDSDRVLQYQLSVGCIRRKEGVEKEPTGQAVLCHWYPTQEINIATRIAEPDLLLSADDLLLIDATAVLVDNKDCGDTMQDYELRYGMDLTPLGTRNASWETDSKSVSVSGSYGLGLTIQGTQKLVPQITLKQHNLSQWRNAPSSALSGTLSQRTGLEVSLCTGNARRVQLKDLFLNSGVQLLIEEAYPGWLSGLQGRNFLAAVEFGHLEAFWATADRSQVADIVLLVLEAFDKTGFIEGPTNFTAAFLNGARRAARKIPLSGNEWLRIVKDSSTTAVYAIATATCLSCEDEETSIMAHGSDAAFTALETLVSIRAGFQDNPIQWLQVGKELIQFSKTDDTSRAEENIMVLSRPWKHGMLHSRINPYYKMQRRPAHTARELLHEDHIDGLRFRTLVKAQCLTRAIHVKPKRRTGNIAAVTAEPSSGESCEPKPPISNISANIPAQCNEHLLP